MGELGFAFSGIDVLAHLLLYWLSNTTTGCSRCICAGNDTLLGVFLRITAIILGHEAIIDEYVVHLLNVQVNMIVVMLVEVAVDVLVRCALALAVLLRLRLWLGLWLGLRGCLLLSRIRWSLWWSLRIRLAVAVILWILELISPGLRTARWRVTQRCLG